MGAQSTAVARAGNPYVVERTLTDANTEYSVDINANLKRNAHLGVLKALATNGGTVQVRFSHNGSDYSNWFTELLPGESMSLDGMDVDTIGAKSDVAGDKVVVEAH